MIRLLNKDRRIKYLGFNDLRFTIIGIFLLSFLVNALLNRNLENCSLFAQLLNWLITLAFTICNWVVMRLFLIHLRKWFPNFEDIFKRISILLIVVILTITGINYIGNMILRWSLGSDFNPKNLFQLLIPITVVSVMIQAIYEAIYYYAQLRESIKKEEKIKNAHVQSQLEALRNQSQPHFFFNSLNTLRDIIDYNEKEDAKKFVNQLANIYRYILDQKDTQWTSLKEEILFGQSYAHIQKERFQENLHIHWKLRDMDDYIIPPLSIQLLIENAIKHNVLSKKKPLFIHIEMGEKELVIRNNLQIKTSILDSTKIGLDNLKKRFELLVQQKIKIEKSTTDFIVRLPLILKKEHHEIV